METIFEVYSAEVQNVLFYSTLAMQPEETKKKVPEAQRSLNYSRLKPSSKFLRNSWLPEIVLSHTYSRNGQYY